MKHISTIVQQQYSSVTLKIVLMLCFIAFGINSFCQKDSLPNKMISFTFGLSYSYANISAYNVNESGAFDMPPPPNTLTKLNGQVTIHDNLNFYEKVSFAKRIIHYNHNSIFLTTGLTYKYITAEVTYYTHESRTPANEINGNGKTVWKEHYLTPTFGVSLYSKISKRMYIENNIGLDYNYILNGKEIVDYKGMQQNMQSYERHENITYSRKKIVGNLPQFIAHQFDAYYKLGINYLYNNMMIGTQFVLPLPNVRNRKWANLDYIQESPSSLLYDKALYHQIAFELSLKLFLT